MRKDKSNSLGCLSIILVIIFFCGLPYTLTLFIPLLIVSAIVYLYDKIIAKKTICINKQEENKELKYKKSIDKSTYKTTAPSIIEKNSLISKEINSKVKEIWKDEYGVEYSNNGQVLEYYSPNINLTEYKVIEGCKIIKRFSFNKELDLDFSECEEIFAYGNNLKTIILPNSIEIIEDNAFIGCEQLQSIIIPKGMIDYYIAKYSSLKKFFKEEHGNYNLFSESILRNNINNQNIEPNIDNYNFYIQNEIEILYSFYENVKLRNIIIRTTGENVVYKEKLKDSRWIILSESVKKRDHYCCHNCFNILQLESINDLYKVVDFKEVATNVILIYNQLKFGNEEFSVDKIIPVLEDKRIYIKRYDIWLTQIRQRSNEILEDAFIGNNRISYFTISKNKYDFSNEYVYLLKEFDMPMRYKAKNGLIAYTNKLLVEKNVNCNSSGHLYLYHRIDYENKLYCDYTGRATLFFDEYAITFPLYHLKSTEQLDVHHKRYAESGNPWDVDVSDLITLCHKCHLLEHQN